jgi:hypothetical protein
LHVRQWRLVSTGDDPRRVYRRVPVRWWFLWMVRTRSRPGPYIALDTPSGVEGAQVGTICHEGVGMRMVRV